MKRNNSKWLCPTLANSSASQSEYLKIAHAMPLVLEQRMRLAARFSNILLKGWKEYGKDHFGTPKCTVVQLKRIEFHSVDRIQ
jgi:hypothetical protein